MSELPRGTVTFAFTDIEGSTALLKSLGDRYGEVLSTHRRLVRDSFGSHQGVEIDTQGDAFFFAFARARNAVEAAAAAQRAHADEPWPDNAVVRMRVGLHTGEPTVGEEGYLGIDVVRAARLCSSGVGGQVLLSETTRVLIGSSLPEGISVFPLGERHLKDIDEPERVFELEIAGVERSPVTSARRARAWRGGQLSEDDLEKSIERKANEFTQRTVDKIFGAVEKMFKIDDEPGVSPQRDEEDTRGLDDIATRANELADRIAARFEEKEPKGP